MPRSDAALPKPPANAVPAAGQGTGASGGERGDGWMDGVQSPARCCSTAPGLRAEPGLSRSHTEELLSDLSLQKRDNSFFHSCLEAE